MDRMTTLYHGSKNIVSKPILGGGKKTNDFGYGFYCTDSKELASEWACPDYNNGFANEYELDTRGLRVLDLTDSEYSVVNWIAILLQNRIPRGISPNDEQARTYIMSNFGVDLTCVDVIKGYRADDSYYSFARDFVRNSISVSQLSKAMEPTELTVQFVLHSQRALDNLRYVSSHIATGVEYYTRRVARDRRAKDEYINVTRLIKVESDDLFIMDIVRQEVKSDDPRLRRDIY